MKIQQLILAAILAGVFSVGNAEGLSGKAMDMAKDAATDKVDAAKGEATEAAADKAKDAATGGIVDTAKEKVKDEAGKLGEKAADKAKDKAMDMGGKMLGK